MPWRECQQGRTVVARLEHGGDLLQQVAALARAEGIAAGELRGLGALRRARLAFYDQAAQEYREVSYDQPLELVALVGNVSRRDGEVAVHAHATLAREDGACVGGHVAEGCEVFAAEVVLVEWPGTVLERRHDAVTGLSLWEGL